MYHPAVTTTTATPTTTTTSTTEFTTNGSCTDNGTQPEEYTSYCKQEKAKCLESFRGWPESEQTEFVQTLVSTMSHHQHSQINFFLKPLLQRDFISLLPSK